MSDSIISIFDVTPPHDPEAEQYVIGALLLDQRVMPDLTTLAPSHFYDPRLAEIFSFCRSDLDDGLDVVPKLLIDRSKKGVNAALLAKLANSVPNASHARYYADIIRQKWVLRTLLAGAVDQANAVVRDQDAESARQVARQCIEHSLTGFSKSRTENMGEIARRLCDFTDDSLRGFPTGIPELDSVVGGWWIGEFTILAALTSAGKSAFAQELASRAIEQGKRVLIVSCEMTGEDITYRALQRLTGIPVNRLRKPGMLQPAQQKAMRDAADRLRNTIEICDDPTITVDDIREIARLEKIRNGLDLVIIDYIQLLDESTKRATSTNDRVSTISKKIRQLPKSLDVSVLALSQFSRNAAINARPQLHHLRDSGSLEQDCHNCWFLWQPDEDDDNRILLIEKNRNGPRYREVDLAFNKERMCFSSQSEREVELQDQPRTAQEWQP